MDHILDTAEQFEEENENKTLRPRMFTEFAGQIEIKQNLKTFIIAARQRNEALDHVFLSGPPGLGKTTLASIIAREMNSEIRITSAPALEKPKDLAGILTTIPEHGVIFIDELHRLRASIEELLYTVMEEQSLDWVIGQGPAARTIRIPLSAFTLVGATTRPGSVSEPMRNRFGIALRLQYYSDEELQHILYRSASLLEIELEEEGCKNIASASRGTPRVANRLLRRIRDIAQVQKSPVLHAAIVSQALRDLQIDEQGLEYQDKVILKTIIQSFGGGPVGAQSLAVSIGESQDSIEQYYEPYLIRKGLLQRTPKGRIVTPAAYALFSELSASNEIPLQSRREGHGDQQTLF